MKINHNKKYTTIAIYTILVFIACILVYKFAFSWYDTRDSIRNIMGLMAPFIFALLIAYFISPMVNFFERIFLSRVEIKGRKITSLKVQRVLSLLISYIVVIGTIVFLLAIVIPQLLKSFSDVTEKLPGYIDSVLEWTQSTTITFGSGLYSLDLEILNDSIKSNIPQTLSQITDMFNKFVPDLLNITKNIASTILNLLFGFVIAIYLLYNKESYLKNTSKIIIAIMPVDSTGPLFKTFRESHRIFSKFFIGKLIDSMIIGIMCFVILLLAKIPYPILISVIVGVTNMIPYFGPFIGGGIGILFLLIGSPMKAFWFAIIILLLQQFDGNILGPKILGDSTGLTPFWVIFAIILFGGIFGLPGMFIGVPCFAVIKNIIDSIVERSYQKKRLLIDALEDNEANPYKL